MRSSRLPSLEGVARRSEPGRSPLPGEVTDLGLALSKRLVELHGGRVWAEPKGEGRGSTFTVVLPFSGPGAPAEALAGARSS